MSSAADFIIKPQYDGAIRWSKRGTCGNPGCTDPECGCSFCGSPIGVAEDDPRWEAHGDWCGDCDLCRDQVPLVLFRGEGKDMEQAQFCWSCVGRIFFFRSHAAS